MIQQSTNSNIASNINSSNFSIEINDSMFALLTKNVYSDTILAPIREWSTNALDACIQAGTPQRFDVHLPTMGQNHFSVRDYGSGLSQEDILGLFSTLGASTKRGSNEVNGTFGIGRMSALAYAQSFTVESFYNNKYYSYLISMQNGIPVAVHLEEKDTTEPNGLLLTLPVELKDITAFKNKAERLYRYFKVKPTVNIELQLDYTPSIQGDDWFIDPSLPSGNYILMSNVLYKIPTEYRIDDKGSRHLVLELPTGSVSINPGRESLSLDDTTINLINTQFDLVETEILQSAIDTISNLKTPFDKLTAYKEALNSLPYGITRNWKYPDTTCSVLPQLLNMSRLTLMNNIGNISFKIGHKHHTNLKDTSGVSYERLLEYNFMIADTKTKFIQSAKAYKTNSDTGLILLSRFYKEQTIEDFITEAKALLDSFGASYVLASDYELAVESTASPRDSGIYVCNTYSSYMAASTLATDPAYWYIPANGTTPDIADYPTIYQAYSLVTGNKPRLVGIPKKYLSKVKESTAFTPAVDAIIARLATQQFYTVDELHYSPASKISLTSKKVPMDIQTHMQDLKAFLATKEKNVVHRDTELSSVVSKFNLKTTHFTTAEPYSKLKTKYKLLDTLLHNNNYSPALVNYYLELEYINDTSRKDE